MAEKIAILEAMAFPKDSKRDKQWQSCFVDLQNFIAENGCMPSYMAEAGSNELVLFRWVDQQRTDYKAGRITRYRIDQLEAIGFVWSPADDQWQGHHAELQRFMKRHGRMPRAQAKYDSETRLAYWCRRQRREKAVGALPRVRVEKLNAIGFR